MIPGARAKRVGLLGRAVVGAVIALSLAVAASARAADPTEADVRVRVIHASNAGGKSRIDRSVRDLDKYLKPFNYDRWRQVIDQTLHLGVSDTQGIGLLSGKNLNATLVALTKEKATIRLLLVGQTGQMLDTTVSAGPHRLFFIAGPRYEDGVLFIAIEPHYDPEKVVPDANVSDSSKRRE